MAKRGAPLHYMSRWLLNNSGHVQWCLSSVVPLCVAVLSNGLHCIVSVSDVATVMSRRCILSGMLCPGGVSEILFCPGDAYCRCPNTALCIPERFRG